MQAAKTTAEGGKPHSKWGMRDLTALLWKAEVPTAGGAAEKPPLAHDRRRSSKSQPADQDGATLPGSHL